MSRFFKFGNNDFNGGSKLKNYKDDYAEYMDVKFELQPAVFNNDKNIYLVGAFTNWEIYEDFKLYEERPGYFSLFVNLKRGIYDYQYVTAFENGEAAELASLVIFNDHQPVLSVESVIAKVKNCVASVLLDILI